jgi:protocatechuate 3,4-dioxygenase beta subunit
LIIVGTVFGEDCTPLENASLEVWQTNAAGEYGPGHGTDDMRCCYLMGEVRTDSSGHYQLITVKPGHYKGQESPPPAHIHVSLSHPDAEPAQTEIVFSGDPYLQMLASESGLIPVTLSEEAGPDGPFLFGIADIVMKTN